MMGLDERDRFPEADRRPVFSVAITMCRIPAQRPIPFINETRHEETKHVDVSCKLDNLLSRERMSSLITQHKGAFAAAMPTRRARSGLWIGPI
jgi:hypothetical protein